MADAAEHQRPDMQADADLQRRRELVAELPVQPVERRVDPHRGVQAPRGRRPRSAGSARRAPSARRRDICRSSRPTPSAPRRPRRRSGSAGTRCRRGGALRSSVVKPRMSRKSTASVRSTPASSLPPRRLGRLSSGGRTSRVTVRSPRGRSWQASRTSGSAWMRFERRASACVGGGRSRRGRFDAYAAGRAARASAADRGVRHAIRAAELQQRRPDRRDDRRPGRIADADAAVAELQQRADARAQAHEREQRPAAYQADRRAPVWNLSRRRRQRRGDRRRNRSRSRSSRAGAAACAASAALRRGLAAGHDEARQRQRRHEHREREQQWRDRADRTG